MYTLNAVKLRNQLLAIRPTLKVELKNVRINGVLQGCSGFVTDPATGRVVYVSTDRNHGTISTALVRTAKHTKDYTGGCNQFAAWADVAQDAVDLLDSPRAHVDENRALLDAAIRSGRLTIAHVTR